MSNEVLIKESDGQVKIRKVKVKKWIDDGTLNSKELAKGINELAGEMQEKYNKLIKEGKCTACGKLREMTIYGLKECCQ